MIDIMSEGTLRIKIGGTEYDLGYVTKIRETFTKTTANTPIVTKKAEDTFAIESGGKMSISVELERINPKNGITSGSDSTKWTNGYWYQRVAEIVDRWQAKTNGCTLIYTPSNTNPYQPARNYNGYIKEFSRIHTKGFAEKISVSLNFVVGTMAVKTKRGTTTKATSNFQISMSNSDGSAWYTLLKGDDYNCIDEYTIEGGMEQPFESISMVIPKNRLSTVAPDLIDDIVPGFSGVIVDAVGQSTMTVVKCKLSNKKYKITAYCNAEAMKGYELSMDMAMMPWQWVEYIITSGEFGAAYSTKAGDDGKPTFIYNYTPKDSVFDELSFKKGTNIWYILQVAALYLGCKVFFAQNKAYCIDCRGMKSNYNDSEALKSYGTLDLYTDLTTDALYGRTTGSVSLGDEGIDTVINAQTIDCQTEEGKSTSITYKSDEKVIRAGNRLPIPELIEGGDYAQATTLAKNIVDYRREAQQSVTFTVKEIEDSGTSMGWTPFFVPNARADEIVSIVDDFAVSNESVNPPHSRLPQKLLLSQYERHYPEGTTTYTFGTIANVDLAVSTSQIVTNQSNGGT